MFTKVQRRLPFHQTPRPRVTTSRGRQPLKLVIDADPGIDDCHAILMVLSCPHVQLLGISCVSGNTSLDNGVRNAHYLLHECGRYDIPVFRGADQSLDGEQHYKPHIHGEDGFGNITYGKRIPLDLLSSESAAEGLVRLARRHRGELVIAAIGPLTNLCLAHQLDPGFSRNIKRLYIMGGNFPIQGSGFDTNYISYNFACDPTAASIVLESFPIPKILVTSALTRVVSLPMDLIVSVMFRYANDPTNFKARLFYDVSQFFIGDNPNTRRQRFFSPDSVCMACLLDESIITETKRVYSSVKPYGAEAAGRMTVDWARRYRRQPNVEVVTKMDSDKFQRLFLKICRPSVFHA